MTSDHIVRGSTVPGTNDGSFAPHHKAEADAATLTADAGRPTYQFAAELHHQSGYEWGQIEQAQRAAGVTGDTITPEQEHLVNVSLSANTSARVALHGVMENQRQMMAARKSLVARACTGAVTLIQARFPRTDRVDLVDNDGGEWYFEAWDDEGIRLDLGFDDPGSDSGELATSLMAVAGILQDAKDTDYDDLVAGPAYIQRTWEGRPTRITLSMGKVAVPR